MTSDEDNPYRTGSNPSECRPTSIGGGAFTVATQKLQTLRSEFDALPQVNTATVEMQRGVVKRLEHQLSLESPTGYEEANKDRLTTELEQEKEKLTELEAQHQQRNEKLLAIQQATRELQRLCS